MYIVFTKEVETNYLCARCELSSQMDVANCLASYMETTGICFRSNSWMIRKALTTFSFDDLSDFFIKVYSTSYPGTAICSSANIN